jgi:hypothetical protein
MQELDEHGYQIIYQDKNTEVTHKNGEIILKQMNPGFSIIYLSLTVQEFINIYFALWKNNII